MAFMVARGDLGVEIGDANLVAVQKQLIEAAMAANKVVYNGNSDDGIYDQCANTDSR